MYYHDKYQVVSSGWKRSSSRKFARILERARRPLPKVVDFKVDVKVVCQVVITCDGKPKNLDGEEDCPCRRNHEIATAREGTDNVQHCRGRNQKGNPILR